MLVKEGQISLDELLSLHKQSLHIAEAHKVNARLGGHSYETPRIQMYFNSHWISPWPNSQLTLKMGGIPAPIQGERQRFQPGFLNIGIIF